MTDQHSTSRIAPEPQKTRMRVQLGAMFVGWAFIIVGILGFIPGVTAHFHGTGGMGFSGLRSNAELFDIFRVSVFHNGLHLLLGLAGLVCSFTPASARLYLILGGVAYLGLSIYGFAIDQHSDANFVPINTGDNWLHLGLAVAMLALGFVLARERPGDRT